MVKHDAQKPDFTLIPQRALEFVAKVMTYGAGKYGRFNWLQKDDHAVSRRERLLAGALRHINAELRGESLDSESGLPHTAHAAASLMMVLELGADELGSATVTPWKPEELA